MSKYEIDSDDEGGLPFKCYICRESFKQPVITKSVCCRGGIQWLRQDFSGEATANYTLRHVNAMHKIARPTNNWGGGRGRDKPLSLARPLSAYSDQLLFSDYQYLHTCQIDCG